MNGRPRKNKAKPLNRLKVIREAQNLSVSDAAELTGFSTAKIYRNESGDTPLTDKDAQVYARAFAVDISQLHAAAGTPMVPIRGYVGAGAQVFPFESDDQMEIDEVECPPGLDPDRTEAYIVRGDSMLPIEPDSIIFIGPQIKVNPIGMHCLVDLADGRRLLKYVRPGPTKGRFNLISSNAPLIEDVLVRRAARVEDISKPPRSLPRHHRPT
jgi:transcriptional regulator with XRE-family HTH domain